jgi:hypothetical protein
VTSSRGQFVLFVTLFAITLFAPSAFAQSPAQEGGSPQEGGSAIEPEIAPGPPIDDKRIFGVIPNYRTVEASVPFAPLTARRKISIATHDSFDWPSYVFAGILALPNTGKNEHLGTGWEGYADRYVRNAGDQVIGNMLTEGILPSVLHQDPRYFRQGSDMAFWPRLRSSLVQIAISRNDSGGRTFNASEFLGNAMAVGISNTYSPNLNSWSARGDKLAIMVGTDMFSNVLKEFAPDLKLKLHHILHKDADPAH